MNKNFLCTINLICLFVIVALNIFGAVYTFDILEKVKKISDVKIDFLESSLQLEELNMSLTEIESLKTRIADLEEKRKNELSIEQIKKDFLDIQIKLIKEIIEQLKNKHFGAAKEIAQENNISQYKLFPFLLLLLEENEGKPEQWEVSYHVLNWLGDCPSKIDAIPLFTKVLKEPKNFAPDEEKQRILQLEAIVALGRIGPNAKETLSYFPGGWNGDSRNTIEVAKKQIDKFEENIEIPIGTVVAWHKNFNEREILPKNWMECNGQKIEDPESIYNGLTLPDLNGIKEPFLGKFLRGGKISGEEQKGTAFQQGGADTHRSLSQVLYADSDKTDKTSIDNFIINPGTPSAKNSDIAFPNKQVVAKQGVITRPINMSVVWIIRIKK